MHVASTVLLLGLVTAISLVLKDLGLVVAFGGAILGSALVYIMPALMFLKNERNAKRPLSLEFALNVLIALFGTGLGGVGGLIVLKKAGVI